MNAFMLRAAVAGDMEYTEPFEAHNEPPVAFSYGEVTTKACILVAFDALLPPDGGLEEGQEVEIAGELREADGEIFPVAKEISLVSDDDDGEEEEEDE